MRIQFNRPQYVYQQFHSDMFRGQSAFIIIELFLLYLMYTIGLLLVHCRLKFDQISQNTEYCQRLQICTQKAAELNEFNLNQYFGPDYIFSLTKKTKYYENFKTTKFQNLSWTIAMSLESMSCPLVLLHYTSLKLTSLHHFTALNLTTLE